MKKVLMLSLALLSLTGTQTADNGEGSSAYQPSDTNPRYTPEPDPTPSLEPSSDYVTPSWASVGNQFQSTGNNVNNSARSIGQALGNMMQDNQQTPEDQLLEKVLTKMNTVGQAYISHTPYNASQQEYALL